MKNQDEDYGLELQQSFDRWYDLYEHGGSDPLWEDGVNLNLVRNHILYYRRQLEEHPTLFGFPDAYYKDVPPVVDNSYMARSDEIRAAAKVSLAKYKADPNYRYIRQHYDDYTPKTRKRLCIDAVIGYATGLENYIKNDQLVDMRRHEHCERFLESFENCVQRMQETPPESFQLTLFSLDDWSEDDECDENEDDLEME